MNIIKYIAAGLFSIILRIRHWLFDLGVIKSQSFNVPIICIGNLKVGGTGKTPMTEFILSNLKEKYNIAVLSRGYKRKTKGFVLATAQSTSATIGDEPMLIHLRHSDVMVAVCEKRSIGIEKILKLNPSINLIILDDAFQHRYVNTTVDILLTEYNSPYVKDFLFPRGRLRDLRNQAQRASYIVVTKCPADVKPIDLRIFMEELKLCPYQSLFFTQMIEGQFFPLFDRGYEEPLKEMMTGDKVVLMTAIANPAYLKVSISERYSLVKSITFRDHHNYMQNELKEAIKIASENNAYIVITEKDATKIRSMQIPSEEKFRFFVAPISINFIDMNQNGNESYFINCLDKRLKSKNGKYSIGNKQFSL